MLDARGVCSFADYFVILTAESGRQMKTIQEDIERALKENNLSPAGLPRIYDVEFDQKSLSFSAEFDVRPELQISDSNYKGIKIKAQKAEVREEELEKVFTSLKEGIKKVVNKDLNDEELARWAGYPDTALLREAIRIQIMSEKLHERRRKIDSQISQHLLKTIKVDLPKEEVERVTKNKEELEQKIAKLRQNLQVVSN